MKEPKQVIIAGSGVSGLLSALLISEQQPDKTITIIEKNDEIGGLLRCFDYGEYGRFDYGAHNILQTGIREVDDLLYGLLPEDEWQKLEGSKRDLAGIYFNHTLQTHTPYIDIRNLGEHYKSALAGFFANLPEAVSINSSDERNSDVYSYAVQRFGKEIAESAIVPSLRKIYKKEGRELDYMATLFTPMDRIALYDEPLIADLTLSPALRKRIAYCDQRNLPLDRSTGRSAYYPRKYGMYRIVDAIKKVLEQRKVTFLTGHEISAVSYNKENIESITVKNATNDFQIDSIAKLIWTSNIPLLGRMLRIDYNGLSFDKPLKTVIVNILVDQQPLMGDLYYFYCYTEGFHTFRVTNFSNYCEGAYRNGAYPIAMELLVDESMLKEDLASIASEELRQFKVLPENCRILFAKAEPLDSGFPMPSVNNIRSLNHIRDSIAALHLSNLCVLGILAEKNLFFQTDVLVDTWQKLNIRKQE